MDKRRLTAVTDYLQEFLQGPSRNQRLKMSAALKLAELLTIEHKEQQAEQRRMERQAAQAQREAETALKTATPEPEIRNTQDDETAHARAIFAELLDTNRGVQQDEVGN